MSHKTSICLVVLAFMVMVSASPAANASPVHRGTTTVGFDAYNPIQAEDFTYGSGVTSAICQMKNETFHCLADITNADFAGYNQVDFGTGAQGIIMIFSGSNGPGQIHFVMDSIDNPPFHTFTTGITNGYRTDAKEFLNFPSQAMGTHDLYLLFDISKNDDIMLLDYFQFFQSPS